MKIDVRPGTYVVAVSGGVDSMALLDMLRHKPKLKLVVAHFDHGIRDDSAQDRQLVKAFAERHQLPFVYHEGNLGEGASEDAARKARYEFLHSVRVGAGARAILTAHHQNDALETAVHNLFRGTGRKGLSSLKNTKHVKRPLLHVTKDQLRDYAESQGLTWREDSTNTNTAYVRNYIRHNVLPRLTLAQKHDLLLHIQRAHELNDQIDKHIATYLQFESGNSEINRKKFINLPHAVSREVMAAWLRKNDIRQFDRKLLERLVVAAKTYAIGKAAHVNRDYYLMIEKENLALRAFDRSS